MDQSNQQPFRTALLVLTLLLTLFVLAPKSWANSLTAAKSNYILQCQGCHKSDGSGTPPETPNFSEYGAELVHSSIGRSYWISVPGAANSPLTDNELADVLNYICAEILMEQDSPKFSAQEVSLHRGKKMKNVYESREKTINQIRQENGQQN
tara:strand:+ start:2448 stop:2903 length:456 start_codon:yes stop_codon:yes gene_type:complete